MLSTMPTTQYSYSISSHPFTMDPLLQRLSNPAEDDFILDDPHSNPIQPVRPRDDIQMDGLSGPGFTFNNDLASMASKVQASMLEPAPSTINPALLGIPALPEISLSPISTPLLRGATIPSSQSSSDTSDHHVSGNLYQFHNNHTLDTEGIQTHPNSMDSNQPVSAGSQSAPLQNNMIQHPGGSGSPMSLDTDLSNPPNSVETNPSGLGSSQSASIYHDTPMTDQHPAGSGSPPMTLGSNSNNPPISNESSRGRFANLDVFSHPFFQSGLAVPIQMRYYRAPPDQYGRAMCQPVMIFKSVSQQVIDAISQSMMGISPPQPQLNPGLGTHIPVPPAPQFQRMYPHAGNGSGNTAGNVQVPMSMPGPQNSAFSYQPVPYYFPVPVSHMSAGPVPMSAPMPMPAFPHGFGPAPAPMAMPVSVAPPKPPTRPVAPPKPPTRPVPASRCISTPTSTTPCQQKRKRDSESPPFVFCNKTAPDFVANPNNHGRWQVDAQGHRLYLNGPNAKKCRV